MTTPDMAALRAHSATVLGAIVDATGKQGTLTIEPDGAVIEHPACGRVSLLVGDSVLRVASKTGQVFVGPASTLVAQVGPDTLLHPHRKLVRPN